MLAAYEIRVIQFVQNTNFFSTDNVSFADNTFVQISTKLMTRYEQYFVNC